MIKIHNISNYENSYKKLIIILRKWNRLRKILLIALLLIWLIIFVIKIDFLIEGRIFNFVMLVLFLLFPIYVGYLIVLVPLALRRKTAVILKNRYSLKNENQVEYVFNEEAIKYPEYHYDKIVYYEMDYISFKSIEFYKKEHALLLQKSFKPDSIVVLLHDVDCDTLKSIEEIISQKKHIKFR